MIHPDMIGTGKKYKILILDFAEIQTVQVLHVQDGFMEVLGSKNEKVLVNLEHVSAMEEVNESA